MTRELICKESLIGASYGHDELYFDDNTFLIVEERWGSVDDAACREKTRPVSEKEAREWIHRNIKDETQLQKALAKMDEYVKRMNENQRPAEEVQE